MTERLYLDHNATTTASQAVVDAMTNALSVTGNPTAQHRNGRAANNIISSAREAVGLAMGVCAQDVIFNSGGTEGCNTAIWSAMQMPATPDYLAVSAHKIGAPRGVGALYVSPTAPYTPLIAGGGQERRRRSGTHNVSGIAGFGAACGEITKLDHLADVRDAFEAELKHIEPNIVFFGDGAKRLPNTSFFAVPDASSMTLMMGLDLAGISVSTAVWPKELPHD